MSPFAFSAGTAEAGSMLGVDFSALARCGVSSDALGPGAAAFDFREVTRRETRGFSV